MSSKLQKRKPVIEEPVEDESEGPSVLSVAASKMLSVARAPLAFLSAHRWKAVSVVAVAALGLAIGTGLVDVGKLWAWLPQSASEGAADGTPAVVATAEAESAGTKAQTASEKPRRVSNPELQTCFTPQEDCVRLIVAEIDAAQSEILVQADSLSAKALIKSLGRAQRRGVRVRVILDKADERSRGRAGAWLIAERLLPVVDTGVASAHSKIMIIDRDAVITGSFDFTDVAQKKNAENVLVVKGHGDVAAAYAANWERRLKTSRPYYGTMAPVM
jgi:phosphatidylserine/phosphatidylglycerophosphate/cardiolipin synthase-like enzyme